MIAGGETSGAVVDRLGIPGFLVGAEIAAGVPVLRAVGAKNGEMLLALKSGNFGGPEFFSDALEADALGSTAFQLPVACRNFTGQAN